MSKPIYYLSAYILNDEDSPELFSRITIHETEDYENALKVLKGCRITEHRPQINLYYDDEFCTELLAQKDEFGLRMGADL